MYNKEEIEDIIYEYIKDNLKVQVITEKENSGTWIEVKLRLKGDLITSVDFKI